MKLLKANNIIIAMAILFSMAAATNYNVSGVVKLENVASGGDHSGVKVLFKDLSNNLDRVDSTLSGSNGTWSKPISAGYYLVEWTKTGYVPMELGGLALGADTTLADTTIMVPGEVAEVSGSITTTTWTTSYVYYVTDDITVSAGETLTINAGVRVKFYSDKGMTVNGSLKANGTATNPVRFTSKEPAPLPGDWGNIVLNGPGNVLTYVYYDYATDGITGDDADNTTIDHLTMTGTLALTANGIKLSNSDSLTLTNNNISTANDFGIYAQDATGSIVEGNTINAGYDDAAIYMYNCDGCTFKNNTIISRPYYGIYARSSDNVLFQGNSLEVYQYGIDGRDGSNQNYISNVITEFEEYAIYFNSAENCTIKYNRMIGKPNAGGTKYALYNDSGYPSSAGVDTTYNTNNAVCFGNYTEIAAEGDHAYGYQIKDSKIYNDTLKIYGRRYVKGIRGERLSITNCYFEVEDTDTWYSSGPAIEVYGGSSSYRRNQIRSNTIYASQYARAIWANYADIDSNYISPGTANTSFTENWNNEWCVGHGDYNVITNNTIVNFQNGIYADYRLDNIIRNNNIDVDHYGIYSNNARGTHLYRNNVITKNSSDWFVYVTNATSVTIDSNRFIGTGTNSSNKGIYMNNVAGDIKRNLIVTPGRGIYITNQAGTSVQNNTIVSINNGDYGLYITNLSTPSITNNIVQGFDKGVYVESTTPQYNNAPIGTNLFYDINNGLFSGENLPVLIGNMVDENANGYTSDIYGNIVGDPLFVHTDTSNYNIQTGSPAVNAGEATINDPDGSVSDIGAYYRHIYVVMEHTALGNTDDTTGPYRVKATFSSPAGASLTGSVHYSVDGGDYVELAMTAASNDTFYVDVPGQALNTTIQYYISATDGTHTSTLPYNISGGGYSFFVSLFNQFANMSGSSNSDGEIELSWGTPVPITGTLTGLKLYKSTSASVALTAGNLYQELVASTTSYTDTETAEGVTYYYKLTGTLNTGTEALVSSEVAVMSDDATKVRVVGHVILSGATDQSGVKVLMAKVSPAAISDSLETDLTGAIDIVMQTGIYNIHFSKDGYQPYLIGNVFFSENTDLDTTTMSPGGSMELSGFVSGTLLSSNIHFVDGNITVASGDTLVIQAGTQIKFRGDYNFTANGPVFAVGTPDSHIVFTSGMASVLVGDWKQISLINAHNSIFRYCDFSFAENGISLNNSDYTEISYCTFNNFSGGVNAVYQDGTNSTNLKITHNTMISGFSRGASFNDSHNSKFNNNEIESSEYGIYCYNCDSTEFNHNEIYPKTNEYMAVGVNGEYSEGSFFLQNNILGFRDYGIYFRSSDGSTVTHNTIADTNKQGNNNNDNDAYGLYTWDNSSDTENIIRHNNIYLYARYQVHGIKANYSSIDSNNVFVWGTYYRGDGIYSNYSDITNNRIYTYWHEGHSSEQAGIVSYNSSANRATIRGNVIYAIKNTSGIYGNHFLADSNTIIGHDDTLGLYTGIATNTKYGIRGSGSTVVRDNSITYMYRGYYGDGNNTVIKNNNFRNIDYGGIEIYSGSNTVIAENNIVMYSYATNQYGLKFRSSNISNVYNNTIVNRIPAHSGTGIRVEDDAHPNINSNIVYGFYTGIDAASEVYVMKFNLVNDNASHFTGDGLPDQVGEIATVNYNGDPSDIYSNIKLSPAFANLNSPSVNTAILSTSAAINAGDVDSLDLDGTVADIGAEFYNYGYSPYGLKADSTRENSVYLSWSIVSTDSLTGYQPYYRLDTTTTWIATSTPVTEQTVGIESLNNNVGYDFAVSALYVVSESYKTPAMQEKPGIPVVSFSAKYFIAQQDASDSTTFNYSINNNGTKDLTYSTGSVVTFTKADYANASLPINQDRITDNVWITRQNSRGLINYVVETSHHHSYSPLGTQWAWGPTDGGQTYTSWRNLKYNNSIGASDHNSMYDNNHTVSLHLTDEERYYNVTWHDWTSNNNGGGFSYTRERVSQSGSSLNQSGTVAPGGSSAMSTMLTHSSNGLKTDMFIIELNDPVRPLDTLYTLNAVGPQASLEATNFTPVDTTANVFFYVVSSGTIDGYSLQTGDEIALYSGATCVGAGMYNGVMPFLVRAFAANPPGDPGFADGDSITVKAWDFGESRVAAMTATLEKGSGTFLAGGFAKVSLTGTIYYTQDITIQNGMFNLISYYLYPQNTSSSTIFGGISDLRIIYEDNGAALIPEYGINTIGDIELTEGYHLFADGDNQTLTITGLSIDPADWPIVLAPNQFNSIAFLHDGPMDAEQAMAAIDTLIEIVQDDAGGAWIPSFGATIGNLIPGKGYQVFTNVDTAISFTYAPYQTPVARSMLAAVSRPEPDHFLFRRTGAPYTIVLQSAVVDGHILETGDEVAVYDGDICVGAVVWNPEITNILTAWRGDEELDLSGYRAGNAMSFQVYKARFKEVVTVSASFTDETQRVFDGSSYSRVSLSGSPGLIPQRFALEQNYPNPFNPVTNIGYHVAEDAPVTLVIYNLMGQEVLRLLDGKVHAPGKYNLIWQATNHKGENVSAGVYLIHMSSSGFSKTKKMILLK